MDISFTGSRTERVLRMLMIGSVGSMRVCGGNLGKMTLRVLLYWVGSTIHILEGG